MSAFQTEICLLLPKAQQFYRLNFAPYLKMAHKKNQIEIMITLQAKKKLTTSTKTA